MTVSIKLNDVDFTSYLDSYKAAGNHAAHGKFKDGTFSGSKYASTEKYTNGWFGKKAVLDGDTSKFAFVAEASTGDLDYSFGNHTLSGSLGKLTIGKGVKADFTLARKAIELDFHGIQSSGNSGPVHKVIYSLKKPATNGGDLTAEIDKHNTIQSGTTASETFRGFAKHDIFKFESRSTGHDTITGFEANNVSASHDALKFATSVFANAQAALAAAAQVGLDTVFTIDATNTLTLKGVALSGLDAGDFAFFA
ncbi:hypothetical protein [Limoniibacter endophyticus]|uniref:Heme acquisition protein HasA n=1 Tax=Limoniibacter endophyticus TaxID=1565040 RepID=A0A8J3GHS7_9HYPH|nr:hypothetical protein [Limoniibacter endophyticus]GHC76750.1 hypothetical protein GCM10010136_27720 [Limoniibacter endophyticus]